MSARATSHRSASPKSRPRAQIDAFEKALDQYRLDTGHYPTGEQGLTALMAKPESEPKWAGPYLKKAVPNDPWGNKIGSMLLVEQRMVGKAEITEKPDVLWDNLVPARTGQQQAGVATSSSCANNSNGPSKNVHLETGTDHQLGIRQCLGVYPLVRSDSSPRRDSPAREANCCGSLPEDRRGR